MSGDFECLQVLTASSVSSTLVDKFRDELVAGSFEKRRSLKMRFVNKSGGLIAKYHTHKAINDVIEEAIDKGWTWDERGTSHCKGIIKCTTSVDGHESCICQVRVNSTPKDPESAARRYRSQINKLKC